MGGFFYVCVVCQEARGEHVPPVAIGRYGYLYCAEHAPDDAHRVPP